MPCIRASARQTNKHRHPNLITCCYVMVSAHRLCLSLSLSLTHTHTYTHWCSHTCLHTCAEGDANTNTCTHTDTCTHTRTCTHTHWCYVIRSGVTVVPVVMFFSAHYLYKQQLSVRNKNSTSVIQKNLQRECQEHI